MNSSAPEKLVVIGASTGGPSHIQKILSALPAHARGTLLIAQHMGSEYLPSFASRMALETPLPVHVVRDGMECSRSAVYICDQRCSLLKEQGGYRFALQQGGGYNPLIDHLFASLLPHVSYLPMLAAILTGIGEDGVSGIGALCNAGVRCVAESKESAIVYGMPMRAIESIPLITQAPLSGIITQILEFLEC